MVFEKTKEMILDSIKTILSEITKDLLSDEIRYVKEKIRTLSIAVAVIFVMLWIILLMNIVILIKVV